MITEEIYLERVDKVLDNLNNLHIQLTSDVLNLLQNYNTFNRNYLDQIEYLIESMNNKKFLWVQIDKDIVKINIKSIKFDSTIQYHNDEFVDIYLLEYENGIIEKINAFELLKIQEKGAVNRINGVIGINKLKVSNLVKANNYGN